MTRAGRGIMLVCAIGALLPAGCSREPDAPSAPDTGVRESWSAQGAEVTLAIASASITTAQRLEATIDVSAPGVDPLVVRGIEPESFEDESRGETSWSVVSVDREPAGPGAARARVVLEPFLPGSYTFPALTIEVENGPTIATQPVPIEVVSVLGAGEEGAELADLKDIVEAPGPDLAWLWAALGGAALVLAAVGAWLVIWLRRRAARRYRTLALAHELAEHRLRALEAAWAGSGAPVEGFLDSASLVLRRYIEDRFALHAPERTTEEFLREARRSVRFREEDVDLLGRFLTHVDEIKFAGAPAHADQAGEAVELIRGFVRRTADGGAWIEVTEPESRALANVKRIVVEPGGEGRAAA